MNRVTIIMLLDQLEEMIDSAPEIPLTGRSLIDGDRALEYIGKIREALPEDLRGDRKSGQEDAVLRKAREEAERLVAEAREYAARLVSEHEVAKRANEEAARLLEEARRRAQELEQEAERYAADVLERLQASLERTLQVVKKGREELRR